MRLHVAFAIAAGALTASVSALGGTPSATSLRVTYWEDGARVADRVTWTLRCNPARGTLPRPARACRRLAAGGPRLFAPLPKDVVCTEIYGGPQIARVVGVVGGKRVWATFARRNGCEIDRWSRVSPWLLPPGGVTS
ncbi:MAG TPA: SSI family serine proteinase inhibitor [Gaiellaceae bacterium]|nr:SSI family serine proteinase inhibitor [Gaiellaceae bacterium]